MGMEGRPMITRTIEYTPDTSTRLVTANYLDIQYLEIYRFRYGTEHAVTRNTKGELVERLELFTIDLCDYLRANGIPISRATMSMKNMLSGVVIELEVPNYEAVRLDLLGYKAEGPLFGPIRSAFYSILPHPEGFNYTVHSTSGLVTSLHSSLGWHQCSTCYYSSDMDNSYCGLGEDMYTSTCTKAYYTLNH
jgi:hypothetical protein